MLKVLYNTNDKKNNSDLAIKSKLNDLKKEVEKISKDEKEIEKPNKIVDIVEKTLEINKQKQEGQRLKILTQCQILSRLPIYLARSKAENNSANLKMKSCNYWILCTDQKN